MPLDRYEWTCKHINFFTLKSGSFWSQIDLQQFDLLRFTVFYSVVRVCRLSLIPRKFWGMNLYANSDIIYVLSEISKHFIYIHLFEFLLTFLKSLNTACKNPVAQEKIFQPRRVSLVHISDWNNSESFYIVFTPWKQ